MSDCVEWASLARSLAAPVCPFRDSPEVQKAFRIGPQILTACIQHLRALRAQQQDNNIEDGSSSLMQLPDSSQIQGDMFLLTADVLRAMRNAVVNSTSNQALASASGLLSTIIALLEEVSCSIAVHSDS
jgi:ATP-dependent DNA ligase